VLGEQVRQRRAHHHAERAQSRAARAESWAQRKRRDASEHVVPTRH